MIQLEKIEEDDILVPREGFLSLAINAFDNTLKIYAEGAWRAVATW